MLRFKFYTFGCKANKYDSALLSSLLLKSGHFGLAGKGERPDVILVNTCTVTGSAGAQARQKIRGLKRENKASRLFALGCYARLEEEVLSDLKMLDGIIKSKDPKTAFSQILSFCKLKAPVSMEEESPLIEKFPDHTRAFLKIQDGCDSFCTYCIIPFARGKPRSMEKGDVIKQIRVFSENGYNEVVLTGIHLGLYGKDFKGPDDLLGLLKLIEKNCSIKRIRLSSIEPDELSGDLIRFIADSSVIMPHLHIPLQSGDDDVLKRMGRKYSRSFFADKIEEITKIIPACGLGSDLIAGFPGEGEEHFQKGLDFIKDLPLTYLHVFPFSKRKGTKAFNYGEQVPSKVIKSRASILRDVGKTKTSDFRRSLLGSNQEVLMEGKPEKATGLLRGFTGNYVPVYVELESEKDYINRVIEIRLIKEEGERIIGRPNEKTYKKGHKRA